MATTTREIRNIFTFTMLQMRWIRIYNQIPSIFNRSPPAAIAMIVCVCRRISDREIARYARAGMGFDEIQLELGVATQCGRCEGCARDLVAQCNASHPVAALSPGDGGVGVAVATAAPAGI